MELENGGSGNGRWTSKRGLPPIPRDLSELEPLSVANCEGIQTASPSTPYSMESMVSSECRKLLMVPEIIIYLSSHILRASDACALMYARTFDTE